MKPAFKNIFIGCIAFFVCASMMGEAIYAQTVSTGKKPVLEQNYYDAVDFLVKRFRRKIAWRVRFNKALNERIAIVSFSISEDLQYSVRDYALHRLEKIAFYNRKFQFKQCKECLFVRAKMVDGEVYLVKGLTSNDELDKVLENIGAKAYAEVVLVTAKPFLRMLINIYSAKDKVTLWRGEFYIRSPEKSTLVTHTTLGYGFAEDSNKQPILLSTFIGERMFSVGEIGFESILGGYYTRSAVAGQDAIGGLFQFGVKMYANVYRIMGLNDAFITPNIVGGLKLHVYYDSLDVQTDLIHQAVAYEGGLGFLIGRYTWLEVCYSSIFFITVMAGFYF